MSFFCNSLGMERYIGKFFEVDPLMCEFYKGNFQDQLVGSLSKVITSQ